MTLGQKIKKLRVEKNLTQKDLSDRLHVSFQTVSKWENDENEPDVSTLRELAKIFDCPIATLIGEEETKEEINKTVIIHQKELHVCERCNKDIPENELAMEDICIRHAGRGHSAEYRKAYYHRHCLDELNAERAKRAEEARIAKAKRARKLSFGWGIAGGIIALAISLIVFLAVPACQENIHPGIAVLLSFIISYVIFADLYCIITGSYIGDVFVSVSGWSIRFPGLIFSWDIEGFAWLIAMKILFAILGFLFGVFVIVAAISISGALAAISFPFILIKNIHNDYADAL